METLIVMGVSIILAAGIVLVIRSVRNEPIVVQSGILHVPADLSIQDRIFRIKGLAQNYESVARVMRWGDLA